MATEIMVEGADELARALRKLSDEVRKGVLAGALAPAALPVLRAAQAYAPKGVPEDHFAATDRLVGSGGKDTKPPRSLAQSLEIRWGKSDADHADVAIGSFGRSGMARGSEKLGPASYQHGFVELGTAHNRAHPYLRPALDSTKDQVIAKVTHWLRYLMSTVGPAT